MKEKIFEKLKRKLELLDREKNKEKKRDLIIDIIVDLEKYCHRDDVNIHMVLAEARERCKKEIKKQY
ncbi:MAG: hypothetical protein QT11_C0001G0908 [archaeon GW2011_AR20]|nr:MAG: hypothetical protein QT11_C0001G0908 [archaeon GW2011_AR20]MBS3160133.1 hypothetical protein [Candidatus Woesearchaeota archaeon]